jgi:hypothetical protein
MQNARRTRKNKVSYKNKPIKNAQEFERQVTKMFLEMLLMIKLYHWKTHIHAEHVATDDLYKSLNDNMDKFVEVLLGKADNRMNFGNQKSIQLIDLHSKNELIRKINYFKDCLIKLNSNKFLAGMTNTDLFNIRDEILGDLNKFLYLLTFK